MKSNTKISFRFEEIKSAIISFCNNKKRLGKTVLILVILVIAAVMRINTLAQNDVQVEVNEQKEINTADMYVDISGEVNKPGVYLVESDTRLYEVIDKAGGLTENANTNQINRADYVEDGEKIVIPSLDNEGAPSDVSVENSTTTASSNGLININLASKEELMGITGVGEVIADRIIEYRSSNRFKSVEDIMNVKGIGNATYEKMKAEITI